MAGNGTDKRAGESNGQSVAHRSSYTDEEIERGLVAVALSSGNARRAARMLKDQGLPIPYRTLFRWRAESHPDRYEHLRATILPELKAQLAEQHTELAVYQLNVSRKMVERLERELEEVPPRDLAGAIRNLDTGSGIHTDKAATLRGEATEIHRHDPGDLDAVMRRLNEIAPGLFIDAEAQEIADAEVVEDTDE